jgi:hypothetical protein
MLDENKYQELKEGEEFCPSGCVFKWLREEDNTEYCRDYGTHDKYPTITLLSNLLSTKLQQRLLDVNVRPAGAPALRPIRTSRCMKRRCPSKSKCKALLIVGGQPVCFLAQSLSIARWRVDERSPQLRVFECNTKAKAFSVFMDILNGDLND